MFVVPEEIPTNARIIAIDCPGVTPKEYARRSGQSEGAVRSQIAAGVIPTYKPTGKKGGVVLVNLMKMAEAALSREY